MEIIGRNGATETVAKVKQDDNSRRSPWPDLWPEGSWPWASRSSLYTHFHCRYCCGKRKSPAGLVEGVTSESDYCMGVRHCSIILMWVHLSSRRHGFRSWHSSSTADLQKDEAAENSLMDLCTSLPCLSFTRSLSAGDISRMREGASEKRSGVTNRRTQRESECAVVPFSHNI